MPEWLSLQYTVTPTVLTPTNVHSFRRPGGHPFERNSDSHCAVSQNTNLLCGKTFKWTDKFLADSVELVMLPGRQARKPSPRIPVSMQSVAKIRLQEVNHSSRQTVRQASKQYEFSNIAGWLDG